jgi:hypothetical protein
MCDASRCANLALSRPRTENDESGVDPMTDSAMHASRDPEARPGSRTLEARLAEDEARLLADEQRMAADEARLDVDEARLAEDEKALRTNRLTASIAVVLAGTLVIAVAGLTISLFAVNRDIESVAKAAPKDDSVGTRALEHAAVTADKLAAGSVTAAAVADGAITRVHVSRNAIGGRQVAPGSIAASDVRSNALTGDQIDERTLRGVASASEAVRAQRAADAALLAGLGPSAFLSRLRTVQATSPTSTRPVKGPVSAACPSGMRLLSGGAAVDGTSHGVALVRSGPTSGGEWVAAATAYSRPTVPWRLVVTAICAAGGR